MTASTAEYDRSQSVKAQCNAVQYNVLAQATCKTGCTIILHRHVRPQAYTLCVSSIQHSRLIRLPDLLVAADHSDNFKQSPGSES
jgi:hypothetical protein